MILKLILLPFRLVFGILRFFLFPWYIRWIFRLHWVLYFGFAAGVGYLAYQQFAEYRFNMLEASLQVEDGMPVVTPLSKWNAATDVASNDEVNVEGLYFTSLPQGQFDTLGLERSFILLADERGREVRAALVIIPDKVAPLQRQLASQGSGDQILVTVNGTFSRRRDWASSIESSLQAMSVPYAEQIVVIEPFLGDRDVAIVARAEKTIGTSQLFAVLAAIFAVIGVTRFLMAFSRQRALSATQSQMSGREAQAVRRAKQSLRKTVPTTPAVKNKTSPWGSFQPQQRVMNAAVQEDLVSKSMVTPRARGQATVKSQPKRAVKPDDQSPYPPFKSVFPMGGSGFRFKSADEIIRQSFGTLSSLASSKRVD